jgi:hypothetical protein
LVNQITKIPPPNHPLTTDKDTVQLCDQYWYDYLQGLGQPGGGSSTVNLPFFMLENYGGGTAQSAATNTTAFASAKAAMVAAGGGVLMLKAGTYQINALPSITENDIFIQGSGVESTVLKFLTQSSSAGVGCLDWRGGSGAAYTLTGPVNANAYQFTFTSVAGLAIGDLLRIVNNNSATLNGYPCIFISPIVAISGTTVTTFGTLPFQVLTTDSYGISKYTPIVGGGLRDVTVDPTAIVNNGLGDMVVHATEAKDFVFDNVAIRNFPGPSGGVSFLLQGGYRCRVNNVKASQTSGAGPLIWLYQCSSCLYDNLYAEGSALAAAPIFSGVSVYQSTYCSLGKAASHGSFERGIKHAGNVHCAFGSSTITSNAYHNLSTGICLSPHVGCTFGQITATGRVAVWIAMQEGFFSRNSIGQIVALTSVTDLQIDPVTALGGGGNNTINSAIYGTIANSQPPSVVSLLAENGAANQFGAFVVNRNGVNQSATASAVNKIQFTNKPLDANNFYDAGTNFRYQPSKPGWYFIAVSVSAPDNASEAPIAIINRNGSQVAAGQFVVSPGASGYSMASTLLQLNGSSDFVEGAVFLPSTTTSIDGRSDQTMMFGWRVGG